MKTRYKFIILATMLIAGIVIGRITTAEKVVVKWRDATPISAEVKSPVPVVVRVPDSIKYITVYRDQMASPSNMSEVVEPPEIDTAASLAATVRDWNVERTYAGMLFKSDTLGTANYEAKVQYNTLTSLKWDFTPKVKEITTIKIRTVRPFVGVGYNTFNQVSATGGVFIRNIGLSATYISDFTEKKNGVGIGIMVEI
ncbi:MAG: hypothetical protein DBY00_07110 [Flavobacteriales bacterium]|nr:MAG: hypothetical protein DBY00_07110 [Flavobacteriales bacterium]